MDIQNIDSVYKLNKYLKQGGDINAPTEEGNLLLTLSKKENIKEELLNKVIKKGIDVNFITSYERNALFYELPFSTIQLLIKNGINVSQKDKDNLTPLFFYKTSEIMKLLIKSGCDPLHTDEKGRTFAHDTKFSTFLSKFKRSHEVDEEIVNDYSFRIELALKHIPPSKIDKYGGEITEYINFSLLSEDSVKNIVQNILKYKHNLPFEREYRKFIQLFPITNDSFVLGDIMLEHFPDTLYSLTKNNSELINDIANLPSENFILKNFKDKFIKELIKKEKEILMNNLQEDALPVSRRRI